MIFRKENCKKIVLYRTYVFVEVHIKMFFTYHIVKCFEKMTASENNY